MSVRIESFGNDFFERLNGMTFEQLYLDTTSTNYLFKNTDQEQMYSNYTYVREDTVIQITENYISFAYLDTIVIIPIKEIKRWKICP